MLIHINARGPENKQSELMSGTRSLVVVAVSKAWFKAVSLWQSPKALPTLIWSQVTSD